MTLPAAMEPAASRFTATRSVFLPLLQATTVCFPGFSLHVFMALDRADMQFADENFKLTHTGPGTLS